MSTTAEALAPQSDAPVSPETAPPDGPGPNQENEAAPSPAADSKSSEQNIEPETNRLKERFAELTKAREDAKRERDFWRDRAVRHEQQQQAVQQQAPKAPAPDKTLADFNFNEIEHQRYLMERAAQSATEAAKRELRAEQERAEQQRRVATYVTRAKDFAKAHDDFKEVSESAPISDGIAKMLIRSEQGPEIAYYLGKNPDFAVEVSNLPEPSAAYELGALAARLKYEREAASKAALRVSQAPPPTPQIGSASTSGASVKPDDPASDKMSDAEWLKARTKQMESRRAKR